MTIRPVFLIIIVALVTYLTISTDTLSRLVRAPNEANKEERVNPALPDVLLSGSRRAGALCCRIVMVGHPAMMVTPHFVMVPLLLPIFACIFAAVFFLVSCGFSRAPA